MKAGCQMCGKFRRAVMLSNGLLVCEECWQKETGHAPVIIPGTLKAQAEPKTKRGRSRKADAVVTAAAKQGQ